MQLHAKMFIDLHHGGNIKRLLWIASELLVLVFSEANRNAYKSNGHYH